jgi:hypothetical protein
LGRAAGGKKGIQTVRDLVLGVLIQVANRSSVNATEEWPALIETSFGFTPAATHTATNV